MDATRILAIRHGETAWNVDTRLQGHLDIPLNEVGLRQASHLAQALAQRDTVDAIYASDLSRAHATASAIAQAMGQTVAVHAGLRERHFGVFQGRTFAQIEAELPEHALQWRKRVPEWTPPGGGESLVMLHERILNTVDELAVQHPGEQIVLVVHGGVLDVLYRAATRLTLQAPRTWQLTNTAVNRLLWTPQGLSLVGWGDTSHLEALGEDETTT
ncbi:histidine phosphatase family protein [Limnohabitans sp. 2KL-17]|uniref:histidine phosphatase family protein n=1 Tax=Limnohabitans sp. 2KL-17 TaxID=1100704 RepID=UPI000D36BE07|nr:histidine phosphatase family protein [Limnohabitans sp. 2KL-17]PUE61710.1 histidine phosphatase family protein [Limnohabitans sp. 2KL-17]